MTTTVHDEAIDPVREIPAPEVIRSRLCQVRTQARLLVRLLRLAESKQALAPELLQAAAPAGGGR